MVCVKKSRFKIDFINMTNSIYHAWCSYTQNCNATLWIVLEFLHVVLKAKHFQSKKRARFFKRRKMSGTIYLRYFLQKTLLTWRVLKTPSNNDTIKIFCQIYWWNVKTLYWWKIKCLNVKITECGSRCQPVSERMDSWRYQALFWHGHFVTPLEYAGSYSHFCIE